MIRSADTNYSERGIKKNGKITLELRYTNGKIYKYGVTSVTKREIQPHSDYSEQAFVTKKTTTYLISDMI